MTHTERTVPPHHCADDGEGARTPWARAAVLVRAAQEGDAIALNDLIDLLTPYVTRLCRPIAHGHTADAVQESLIAVFQGLDRLKDPTALYAWVRTVTLREAVRVARRAARETPVSEIVDRPVGGHEVAAEVRDVLRRLPEAHREVLVLRAVRGLDEKAAGALLNVSHGTVKSRLHRARHGFRAAWTR
ncbi:sigma-70 family RNA polymerase sigma factor [Streptomyces sp. NPDC002138]|uniref:RNA polymerase sigma factor n=1 Tax=Streptomyces sp. NPDC002138 TaxID=3154410 RepID=UPI0033193E1B